MDSRSWIKRNVLPCLIVFLNQSLRIPANICTFGFSEAEIKLRPEVALSASPHPYVRRETNVTLQCTGRTRDRRSKTVDQIYIRKIELKRNGDKLPVDASCRPNDISLELRNLTCSKHVTNISDSDNFECFVFVTGFAACNSAKISFKVKDGIAPKITYFGHNIVDAEKLEMECHSTGFLLPSISWLFNGSKKINKNTATLQVYDIPGKFNNISYLSLAVSKIIIVTRNDPFYIQCLAENGKGKVFSRELKIRTFSIEVIKVTFTEALVQWSYELYGNNSFVNRAGFNISLRGGNTSRHFNVPLNQSHFGFRNLTMGKEYEIKIQSFTEDGGLIFGAHKFYLLTRHPKPHIIKPIERTSQSVAIQWKSVPLNETIYGELTGYKVLLKYHDATLNYTLPSNQSRFQATRLLPKTNYSFTVSGLTQNGEGHRTIIKFVTLDVIPRPQQVMITNKLQNSVSIQWNPIQPNEQKYDKILGYRVIVRNETLVLHNRTVPPSETFINLANLLPNTNYKASVVGYGVNGDGNASEWKSFKTLALPFNRVPSSKKSSSTGTVIAIVVPLLVGIGLLAVVLVAIFVARRKKYLKAPIKVREIKIEMENKPYNDNLRILFPEYYNDNNGSEDLPKWEIPRARLVVLDNVLGGGYFGVVKEATLMPSLETDQDEQTIQVAIKTLKMNRPEGDWNEILRELDILKHLNTTGHPNVIRLIGACTQTVPILLVFELCPKGNLKDFLATSKIQKPADEIYENIYSRLTERQLMNFAVEVASGMDFLCANKVVHRDLACRNVLLGNDFVPKISDFGLARKVDTKPQYIVNKNRMLPVKWMAIESLEEGKFTLASDIWSYGVLLWEICMLAEEPYPDLSPYDMLDFLLAGQRMTKPDHCSVEIFELMERCWKTDPDERPSCNEIITSLQSMMTDYERSYVNVRTYHSIPEIPVGPISGESIGENPKGTESSSEKTSFEKESCNSGVSDTYL